MKFILNLLMHLKFDRNFTIYNIYILNLNLVALMDKLSKFNRLIL